MVYKRVRVKHRMKYEVLIVRKMFLNEPETARRKKKFHLLYPGHGRAGNKRGVESDWLSLRSWRDLCESAVLFLRRSNPCASRQFAGYDKLPDDQTQPTLEMTPGFKPFTARQVNHFCILGFVVRNVPSGEERGETDVFAGYEQSLIAEFSF